MYCGISMNAAFRKVLFWQVIAGMLGSAVIAICSGAALSIGFAYGVLLMMLNGVFLAARVRRASAADSENGQRLLYAGAVLRFMGVMVALMLAYRLGLYLLVVAAGMLVAQVTLFIYAARHVHDSYVK